MSRIRTIKPELFSSLSAKKLTMGARWLFAALLCEADDEGRMLASARKIAGNVFPHEDTVTELDVAGWLNELEAIDRLIERYEVGGVRYLRITNFRKHQRISHPTPSRIPPPPEHPPESLAKSSGEVPERLGKDLGNGIDLGNGSGSGRAPPANVPSTPTAGGGSTSAPKPPTTPRAVLDHPDWGPRLRQKFPALDGEGARPTLIGEVTSDFRTFQRKWSRDGPEAAFHGLVSWISKRYGPHEVNFRRNGGIDVDAIVGRGDTS